MKHIKFCPKCKSLNIRSKFIGFLGFPAQYRCRDCGYQAFIFPTLTMEQLKELGNRKK
jgi:transposase-like protein